MRKTKSNTGLEIIARRICKFCLIFIITRGRNYQISAKNYHFHHAYHENVCKNYEFQLAELSIFSTFYIIFRSSFAVYIRYFSSWGLICPRYQNLVHIKLEWFASSFIANCFPFLEMRQRKMVAYQQQQQLNFQMNAMQAMQNPYFRMQFMPPQMQSMMLMQMRAPALAANQRAQLQAMINSMPPEARQAFVRNLKSGGSMASMYGQPSTMSGK